MDAKLYVEYALRTEVKDNHIFSTKVLHNFVSVLEKLGINPGKTITGRIIKLRNIRLLHFAIGMATEIAEVVEFLEKDNLDFVNLSEELSDQLWYMAIAIDELKLDPYILDSKSVVREIPQDVKTALEKSTLILSKETGIILDYLKKMVFYGKDVDAKNINEKLVSMIREMDYMCQCAKVDFVKGREINIAKLAKRYGEKFSEFNALNRQLEIERTILDKINE